MTAVTIRHATLADAEALACLAERTFRDTFMTENTPSDMASYCMRNFGPDIQKREIDDPNLVTLLAEKAGKLTGYAQLRLRSCKACVSAQRPSELRRLYILTAWQGRGVAHALMRELFSVAQSAGNDCIWLGVWEHNARALAFYQKYEFKLAGEHIFQLGSDAQRDLILSAMVEEIEAH